jgi:hypothetical protein
MPLPKKTQSYTFGVLTNVAQMEICHRQQSLREAFGNTTPRISFNPEVSKAILLRWMAICNIPFKAAENTSFRLLAGYLPACVRSCCSSHLVCILADGADFLLVMGLYR